MSKRGGRILEMLTGRAEPAAALTESEGIFCQGVF